MNDVSSLIQLIFVLAIFGVVAWLFTTYVPMPQPIKTIIMVIVVLAVCLYLLSFIGLVHFR